MIHQLWNTASLSGPADDRERRLVKLTDAPLILDRHAIPGFAKPHWRG